MLALVFIYWIGKQFYKLAQEFGKNAWAYAFLGIGIFYGSQMAFGLTLGVVFAAIDENFLDDTTVSLLNYLGIPLGMLACYGIYKWLEVNWKAANEKQTQQETKTLQGQAPTPIERFD